MNISTSEVKAKDQCMLYLDLIPNLQCFPPIAYAVCCAVRIWIHTKVPLRMSEVETTECGDVARLSAK